MPPSGPSWSVVVPTRSRLRQLADCLSALALCAREVDCEVVVVDDDSSGSARPVAERAPTELELSYLCSGGGGPAAARNLGAEAAGGDLLAFTDDDCEPDPGWLKAFGAALAGAPGAAAAGSTTNIARSRCSEASQAVVRALERSEARRGEPRFAASNNVAFPREALLALGGFDTSFPLPAGEDRDLCDRWLTAGHRFVSAPDARVRHRHELGLTGFWHQHLRYGRGAYAFHRDRRSRGNDRVRGLSRFYGSLAAEVRAAGERRVSLTALLAVSQLANLSGYGAEAARQRLGRPNR